MLFWYYVFLYGVIFYLHLIIKNGLFVLDSCIWVQVLVRSWQSELANMSPADSDQLTAVPRSQNDRLSKQEDQMSSLRSGVEGLAKWQEDFKAAITTSEPPGSPITSSPCSHHKGSLLSCYSSRTVSGGCWRYSDDHMINVVVHSWCVDLYLFVRNCLWSQRETITGHHRASIYTPKNYQPGQKSRCSDGLRPKFGKTH